jgi:hypothetical protein
MGTEDKDYNHEHYGEVIRNNPDRLADPVRSAGELDVTDTGGVDGVGHEGYEAPDREDTNDGLADVRRELGDDDSDDE